MVRVMSSGHWHGGRWAVELWGVALMNRRVCFWTDNVGVFLVTAAPLSPSSTQMPYIHLGSGEGVENQVADALSHFQFQVLPEVDPEGTPCPPELWELVKVN